MQARPIVIHSLGAVGHASSDSNLNVFHDWVFSSPRKLWKPLVLYRSKHPIHAFVLGLSFLYKFFFFIKKQYMIVVESQKIQRKKKLNNLTTLVYNTKWDHANYITFCDPTFPLTSLWMLWLSLATPDPTTSPAGLQLVLVLGPCAWVCRLLLPVCPQHARTSSAEPLLAFIIQQVFAEYGAHFCSSKFLEAAFLG